MIQYLVAAFFSILGNCLCVYFVNHGLIVLTEGQSIMDVYFHTNCINLVSFTILFWIQKAQGKVKFRAIDTFRGKKEMVQFLLFFFPVVASCYKTYMLDFVPITTITISSMIVPFTVWILATFLLREVFRKSYIKYSILSLIGFIIVNASKLSNGQWVEIRANIRNEFTGMYGEVGPVLYCSQITKVEPCKPEVATF